MHRPTIAFAPLLAFLAVLVLALSLLPSTLPTGPDAVVAAKPDRTPPGLSSPTPVPTSWPPPAPTPAPTPPPPPPPAGAAPPPPPPPEGPAAPPSATPILAIGGQATTPSPVSRGDHPATGSGTGTASPPPGPGPGPDGA